MIELELKINGLTLNNTPILWTDMEDIATKFPMFAEVPAEMVSRYNLINKLIEKLDADLYSDEARGDIEHEDYMQAERDILDIIRPPIIDGRATRPIAKGEVVTFLDDMNGR